MLAEQAVGSEANRAGGGLHGGLKGQRMYEAPSDQSGETTEAKVTGIQPDLTVAQTAVISYAGMGFVFGAVAGVVTFIGTWAYCVMTYGFVLGLGLGWFPAAICAGVVGWATVVLWGAALLILVIGGLVLIAMFSGMHSSLALSLAFGAAIGWLVWRVSPTWLKGK
jgi:hypothetical protein